jgi:hypothetical protein
MLASVIGDTLPLAIGVAINPIAILAGILILGKAKPRRNGIAYALGWVLGLTLLLFVLALLVQNLVGNRPGTPSTVLSLAEVGLGALLVIAAVLSLRNRPLPAESPAPPRWFRLLEQGGVGRAFGTGVVLATFSLKNVALLAAAASVIGQAGLDLPGLVVVVAVFVGLGTIGILIPILIYLFGGDVAEAMLDRWRMWLSLNAVTITAIVLIILGTSLLGKGIGGLS